MARLRAVPNHQENAHPVWTDGQVRLLVEKGALSEVMLRREMAGYCDCGMSYASKYHERSTCGRGRPLKAAPAPPQPWSGQRAA